MEEDIRDFCKVEIAEIMGTDDKGIEVKVERTADHKNTDCFKVSITNNQSPVLTTVLYPDNNAVDALIKQDMEPEEVEAKEEPVEEINDELKKEILDYLDETVSEFDASNFSSVEEVNTAVQAYLFSKLADKYKEKINVAPLFKMSNEYVATKLRIEPNKNKKEDSKEETIESQL
jgi:hypothetical protein